jgi:hypothetical protein
MPVRETEHVVGPSGVPRIYAAFVAPENIGGRVAELAPQFLEMARNAKNPIAPSALIALGDLHETRAVATVRAGLASRNTELLTASARSAVRKDSLAEDEELS